MNSVNRAGYGYLINTNAKLFFGGDTVAAATSINWISLLVVGLMVFEILSLLKQDTAKALLGAILTVSFSNLLWLGLGVFNDVSGIALLLVSYFLALLYTQKPHSWKLIGSILFLIAASSIRLEYFLGIIPLLSTLKLGWPKTLITTVTLLVCQGLLLAPLYSPQWLSGQAGIFEDANLVHVYSLFIFAGLFIAYFKFRKRSFAFLGLGVALLYLILPIITKERFFYGFTMQQFLPVIILAVIISLLSIFNYKRSAKLAPDAEIFGFLALLFAAFYHTYHFHHLVVIFPFACINLICLLSSYKLPRLLTNLLLLLLIGVNFFNYFTLFYGLKEDLPQYLAKTVLQVGQSNGGNINAQNSLIYSEFPLEMYYWTGLPATAEVTGDRTEPGDSSPPQYLLYVDPANRANYPVQTGYTLISQEQQSFKVNYQMFYQNRPISDYSSFKVSVYRRN